MNWSRVIYSFFALMSLTTTVGFLYEQEAILLFISTSINLASTLMKLGVKNHLSAEIFAGSLVADLHLMPAFLALVIFHSIEVSIALAIGAIVANVFSIIFSILESIKANNQDDYLEF